MKLNYLRLQNVRSLADTKAITLRPINILVGVNSSGKSTFLRSFPLLRQSVETITTGPVLWYGRYVDFGSFAQTVRQNASPEEIVFDFGLTMSRNVDLKRSHFYYYSPTHLAILDDLNLTVSVALGRTSKDEKTYAKRIQINSQHDRISLEADEAGNVTTLRFNDFDASLQARFFTLVPSENLLPQLAVRASSAEGESEQRVRRRYWEGPLEDLLRESFKPLFSGRMSLERRQRIAHAMGLGSPESQLKFLQGIPWGGTIYARRVSALTTDAPKFLRLREAVLASSIPRLLTVIDVELANQFRAVRYIAPVRATAERFYRQQDLAVDEVDPQGANLAMFLQSLSWTEKDEFSSWCERKLGFSVQARSSGSHISLFLRESDSDVDHNIADMGFGFSQILPILAQLWSLTRATRPRSQVLNPYQRYYREDMDDERGGDLVTIEQPELHLHPRLQAKVADMFAAAASESRETKRPLTLIFETHSETIVNRIGHLIHAGHLQAEDVQLLFFQKLSAKGDTEVSLAHYDSSGVLQNWPHGFFLAAGEDLPRKSEPATTPTVNE